MKMSAEEKLQKLHDAKVKKEFLKEIRSKLGSEFTSAITSEKFHTMRKFIGEHGGKEFNDLTKYSPVLYVRQYNLETIQKNFYNEMEKIETELNNELDTL